MKQQLLKSLRLRVTMLVAMLCGLLGGASQAWGETETIDLSKGTFSTDHITWSGTSVSVQQLKGSSSTAVNSSYVSAPRVYKGHILSFEANEGYVINSISITVNTTYYGNSMTAGTVINNNTVTDNTTDVSRTWTTTSGGTHVVSSVSNSGLSAIYIQNVASASNVQLRISSITITYTSSGTPVTPTCATPTFSPAAGAVFSDTEVSISSTDGATIYYTTDGNDPTTSSSVYSSPIAITEATTIKAYAVKADYNDSEIATAVYTIKKAVSGYTIDFENDLDCYTDWTFNNIGTSNTAITAHGGSKYGANINASGNGVTTAFIQTNEPIALPNTFTCYVSKASTNTTASTWIVQVSSDGSEWTDVGDGQSAASMEKGTWVEYTVNLSGYSNVYVKLSYGSSGAIRTVDDISITMRDPDEKITPVVTIDATDLTTDLAGSTNVSAGTATATVTSGETSVEGATVTWSSSDTGVATIDASTGAVTLIAVGTTTLTATFAGDDDYNEASATFELTVIDSNAPGGQDNPYTVARALEATPASGNSETVYVRGIVSAFYGEATGITGDKYNRYYISDDGTTTDQLLVYRGKGLNNVAFSSDDDLLIGDVVVITGQLTTYNSTKEFAANNYIVSLSREKQEPTIPVSDVTVAYGSTFTFDDSNVEGGDVTLTSSITKVATVNGLTITPKAVGTTTITVATAESVSYNAGIATFTLTVTAPEGQTTAAPTGGSGDFVKVTSTADITSGEYLIVEELGEYAYAFNGALTTLDAVSNNVEVEKVDNTITGDETANAAIFTIDATAGTIKSASGYYIGKTANSNGLDASTTEAYTNTFAIDANGDAVITASGGCTLRYNSASNQDRFRYYASGQSAIQLYKKDSGITISYTIPDSGIGTFCSEYPLDLSDLPEGVKAYAVESQSETSVTLAEITTAVKGGTGFIIKGTGGTTITFSSVDSDNVPQVNKLIGTLAPTYVAANTVYGMKSGEFHPNNAGTIPANRAYLPAEEGSSIKALTLIFKDADGITETRTITDAQTIYDLTGRRLQTMQKGMNIVGGKKMMVK